MKVAILSDYHALSGKGGAEISTQIMAEELSKKNVEVHIFTRPVANLKTIEIMDGVCANRNLKSLERFTFADGGVYSVLLSSKLLETELIRAMKNNNFDLIHSNGRDTAIGAVWAARKLGIPIILHIRDYWPICQTRNLLTCYNSLQNKPSVSCIPCHYKMSTMLYGKRGLWRLPWATYAYLQTEMRNKFAKKASYYIAISNFVKFALEENGFDENKISLIPNPIKFYDSIIYDSRREPKTPQYKKKVLFIGTLNIHKGLYDLIKAVEIVKKEIRNIDLKIIGDGPLKKEIHDYILSKDIEYIHLIDRIPHKMVFKAYKNADAVVVPSIWPEPFGRVVAESMSVGTPVVAYDVGGISDIIDNGKNGFLVPVGNIEKLAASILLLLEDEDLRKKLGDNAREDIFMRYNAERIAKDVLEIYFKLLA